MQGDRVTDHQDSSITGTQSSGVDSIWTAWQQLTEAERTQFMDRVRHDYLTRVPAPQTEQEKVPHYRHRQRRKPSYTTKQVEMDFAPNDNC